MLGIVKALTEGGRVTVASLAGRFRTTRQSIYRDLHGLEVAGVPVVGDADGGYAGPSQLEPEPVETFEVDAVVGQERTAGCNGEGQLFLI